MVDNKCKLFKRCGGCQLDMDYARQLEWKQEKANRLLGKFCKVEPIIGMENPYHYRNKVQHGFYTNTNRQIISGIFQSNSGKIIPYEDCNIEDTQANKIISTIRILMRSFKIFPFNPNTGKGLIRHVMVRKGFNSGEYLVCIVTARAEFPSKKNFVSALKKAHPYITTVVQNVCANPLPLTLGEQEFILSGKGYIEDTLCDKKFKISAQSFYQVNPVQTEILYGKAMEFASLKKTDRVLDCYCGTGTIGIIASDYCGEVLGVELNKRAFSDARKNAKDNGVRNITFVCEDSGKFVQALAESGESCDVVFTDPPRQGSDKRFLENVAKLSPKKIVYISCGIDTLERDLKILKNLGYHAQKIQPVDMFPHTRHVETVCLLTRKNEKLFDLQDSIKMFLYHYIKQYIQYS